MVAPEDAPAQQTPDNTGTFGKLKQTLSSSLLTAQDKGNAKIWFYFFAFYINSIYQTLLPILFSPTSSLFCLNLRNAFEELII